MSGNQFRPCISVFDKVTAFLIVWESDRKIDGKFYNDVIGRSRDLLKILVLLKKTGKWILSFLCIFNQIEAIRIIYGCRTKLSPLIK